MKVAQVFGKAQTLAQIYSSRDSLPKSEFEEATKNPIVAFIVAFVVLVALGVVPSFWAVVWSVIASFLLFEAAMGKLARGGSGIFQFSVLGVQALAKGHAFLIFVALVLGVTLTTSFLSDLLAKGISTYWPAVLAADFVVCVALYIYMDDRYFTRVHNT